MNEKESGHCKVEELKMIYKALIKLLDSGPLLFDIYKEDREFFEKKLLALISAPRLLKSN